MKIQRPDTFHFKAFGMMNLHYEIRICQKIYNRVTTHNKSKCLVRNSLHQTLHIVKEIIHDLNHDLTFYCIHNQLCLQAREKHTKWDNLVCLTLYIFEGRAIYVYFYKTKLSQLVYFSLVFREREETKTNYSDLAFFSWNLEQLFLW